jgi:hypothetical protein
MKKFAVILTVVLAVFVFASCATNYPNTTWYSAGAVSVQTRAEGSNTVWFGVFGEGTYPLAEKLAFENGITRIATVERYFKVGLFGLWIVYTTVITGEGGGAAPAAQSNY